jgi:hypothetical protein
MSRHVNVKPLVVAGVVGACAFAVPTASALQDVGTPDPSAARATHRAIGSTDFRSADAKDAAVNPSLQSYRTPTIIEVASPAPASSSAFDWGDAGIGAGGTLAVIAIAIAVGGTVLVTRRRSARARVSPAAH